LKNKINLNTLLKKNISLTSDHHYILKENNSKQIFTQSVTDIIESHFKGFDADLVSKSLVKYAPKYKGMDPYDIQREWEKKKEHGSKVHAQIEKYILNEKKPTFNLSKIGTEWFDENYQTYGDEYCPEVRVFSEAHRIGGTVDLLIYNKEKDGCYIFDWKTSGSDIYKSKGKGISSVTSDLKDCKFTTFELQLSMYKYLLQEIHDIKIINHFVLHLKDSGVDLIKTKYYKSHSKRMLQDVLKKNIELGKKIVLNKGWEEYPQHMKSQNDDIEEFIDIEVGDLFIDQDESNHKIAKYQSTPSEVAKDYFGRFFEFLVNSGILWWGGIILFIYWLDNC